MVYRLISIKFGMNRWSNFKRKFVFGSDAYLLVNRKGQNGVINWGHLTISEYDLCDESTLLARLVHYGNVATLNGVSFSLSCSESPLLTLKRDRRA